MKIGEVIQRIESYYSKGVPAMDSRLTPIFIYDAFTSIRKQQLVRKLNKKQPITESNKQVISCVELINAPKHECNCLPDEICKVKRSKYKIPKIIGSVYGDAVVVESIDGRVKYSMTTFTKSAYVNEGMMFNTIPFFYLHNGYLYVINSKAKVVKLIGVFADILEVYAFEQLCDVENNTTKCLSNYEVEFEIDDELFEDIMSQTIVNVLDPFIKLGRQDIRIDLRDDPAENTK